jgi:hypothetical protein
MKQNLAFLLCALMAAVGCTAVAPPAPLSPPVAAPPPQVVGITVAPSPPPVVVPPPAVEEPAPPVVVPPLPEVTLKPPVGWTSVPRVFLASDATAEFRHQGMRSAVLVKVALSDKSAADDVEEDVRLHAATDDGAKFSPTRTSKDGKTASITVSRLDRELVVTVRHYGPDGHASVTFVGIWMKANAKVSKAVYDALVKTATVK